MNDKLFRDRLRSGQPVFGIHLTNFGGATTAIVNHALEVDFVFIDTEHIPLDRAELAIMCHHYRNRGIVPIARILYPNLHLASAAYDGGATGVVVPYVEQIEEIELIAGFSRLRPLKGTMLQDVVSGKKSINEQTITYLDNRNENNFVLMGIESVQAIENLDILLKIKNVDAVFIGPHDLSVTLQIPEEYTHPLFVEAVETIITKSREAGVGVGMHLKAENTPTAILERYINAGMNFFLYSHDTHLMCENANSQLNQLREQVKIISDNP